MKAYEVTVKNSLDENDVKVMKVEVENESDLDNWLRLFTLNCGENVTVTVTPVEKNDMQISL